MSKNDFKNLFIRWARDDYGLPKNKISSLKHIINTQFWTELATRDIHKVILLRPLSNSQNLVIKYFSDEVLLYVNSKNELVIGTYTPTWKHGWRQIDDDLRDLLQFFLHFSEQYVARSRTLNATGAIALTFGKACDFRFRGYYNERVELFSFDSLKDPTYKIKPDLSNNYQSKDELEQWIKLLNCLDQKIH